MDFGVVLQTNPPAARVVQLAQLAEAHGFSHVWTFDSHLLWEEPYVIHSAILAQTNRVIVGPFVTNPATRDWTVTASVFATLNEMYGNRTICGIGRGDSAVRVTNGSPVTMTERPANDGRSVAVPELMADTLCVKLWAPLGWIAVRLSRLGGCGDGFRSRRPDLARERLRRLGKDHFATIGGKSHGRNSRTHQTDPCDRRQQIL